MDKVKLVINKALEPYRPAAARQVEKELCSTCPDRRCETGVRCKTYHLFVDAKAWDMASGQDIEGVVP